MIRRLNLHVKTENAFPSCGCVISITTVVTIRMSLRSCAVSATVQQDGNAALAMPTTVAYPSGFSVMARMTAVTIRTNKTSLVLNATQTRSSAAPTTVAYPSSGCAISMTIAVTEQTRMRKPPAKTDSDNVQRANLGVIMVNA